eukprot:2097054-Prymnesium_polylepis.1
MCVLGVNSVLRPHSSRSDAVCASRNARRRADWSGVIDTVAPPPGRATPYLKSSIPSKKLCINTTHVKGGCQPMTLFRPPPTA